MSKYTQDQIDALDEYIGSLKAQNEELKAMLMKHQWGGSVRRCISCGQLHPSVWEGVTKGHSPDCALARLIK